MPTVKSTDGDTTGFAPSEVAIRSYSTPIADLTTTGTYAFPMPNVLGKKFFHNDFAIGLYITSRTGTVTGNLTCFLAQNGVQISQNTGAVGAAALTANFARAQCQLNFINVGLVSLTAPLQIVITIGATGASVLKGYFEILGRYE